MKKSPFYLLVTLIIIALLVTACSQTQTPVATEMPDLANTAAIQTIVAGLTLSAPTDSNMQGQALPAESPVPTVILSVPSEFIPTETFEPSETLADSAAADYSATPEPTETVEPTETPEPTETETPTPLPELQYWDDFSGKAGWTTDSGDNYAFSFTDGGYQVMVKVKEVPIWSVRSISAEDVQLEVDATVVEGAGIEYFGLVCRHTSGANFYALVVGSDGFYGIAKKGNGRFTFLKHGNAMEAVDISSFEPNRVRADCMGNTLSIYVNDVKLAEVQDNDYLTGDVGMVVGLRSKGKATILFDNFAVYTP